MQEFITKSRMRTTTVATIQDREYIKIEDLRGKYKDKPDKFKNLLENAPRMVCEITKEEFIVEPKYKHSVVNEESVADECKRRIEGEGKLKHSAPNRKQKKTSTEADGEAADSPKKPCTEVQNKRSEKAVPKLQEVAHKITEALLVATSSELKQWVPPAVVEIAKGYKKWLDEASECLEACRNAKEASAKELNKYFAAATGCAAQTKAIIHQIQSLAGMANPVSSKSD